MIAALMLLVLIGFSCFGFYSLLDKIAKKWGKRTALYVTLAFGVAAIAGLIFGKSVI